MDETKIEQVEAQAEEVKAEEAVEVEAQAEAPAEEVAEAPEAQAEEVAEEEAVTEECSCGKCDACKAKKETEDDEDEKKVNIKVEAKKSEAEETEQEVANPLIEQLEEVASLRVADMVTEAIASLPIEEGMSEEDVEARKEEIMENGKNLLAHIFSVLEEVVAGTTLELNGHQVEVKDFVGTGGKVGMGLPAGINPPCKSEDDESEKKVTIKAYHEGVEEIDYQAKYAESEALMDDLVATVENTAGKYAGLVEEYNKVATELQAYKLAEAYSITVDDALDMLGDASFDEVCEALNEAEAELNGEEVIAESEEAESEEVATEEETAEEVETEEVVAEAEEETAEEPKEETKEEEKKEKEEEKKEEEQEEALEKAEESVEETPEIEGAVVSEAVEEPQKIRAFSVFASNSIVESKKARKAYSVFAD